MQVSIEELVSIFKRNIERDNLRNTPSRITILKAAYSHKGHFNAETIYNAIKDDAQSVSLATVYNTLELLQQYGLVRTHKFGNLLGPGFPFMEEEIEYACKHGS